MTNTQESASWRKAVVTNGTIPDISHLTIEQLEADIAALREQRQQEFIDQAATLGLRFAPRRRSSTSGAASVMTRRERLTQARSRSPVRLLSGSNGFWSRYNNEVRGRLIAVAVAERTACIDRKSALDALRYLN